MSLILAATISPQLPRPSAPTPSKLSGTPTAGAAAGAGGAGANQANERMLADFFNQLLLKDLLNFSCRRNIVFRY